MNKGFILTFMFFFCLLQPSVKAQKSMVPEISYVYVEKLIAVAKENYPRVKQLQSRVNVSKYNITKAQLAWFDGLSFSYVYQPNNTLNIVNPNFFNGYQLGVFLNLGSLIQKPFNVRQAKEQLNISVNDQEEYELNLIADVKKRYFTYIQFLTTLKMRSQAVDDAESILKIIKIKFEKGEETFENYNQALLTYTSQNESKIQNEANLLIAKADLEELLGQKLETIQ
jgi:outer membrane protein TolC